MAGGLSAVGLNKGAAIISLVRLSASCASPHSQLPGCLSEDQFILSQSRSRHAPSASMHRHVLTSNAACRRQWSSCWPRQATTTTCGCGTQGMPRTPRSCSTQTRFVLLVNRSLVSDITQQVNSLSFTPDRSQLAVAGSWDLPLYISLAFSVSFSLS
jgi:hypothetical protein